MCLCMCMREVIQQNSRKNKITQFVNSEVCHYTQLNMHNYTQYYVHIAINNLQK